MAFETRTEGSTISQINVVPLVDVMLVLLVIFMVTAPILQQGIEVRLPQVRAEGLPGESEQFVVTVDAEGTVYLNDVVVPIEGLAEKLAAIGRLRPDQQVFLRADRGVAYGRVMAVMAAVREAGIQNLGMVTELPVERE